MSALSDYLESGVLNYIFRGESFATPPNISLALTSGVPEDNQDGSSIPELANVDASGNNTGYARLHVCNPMVDGSTKLQYIDGSGLVSNINQLVFNTALKDWGHVSGVAIVDSSTYGQGNVLMHAALERPREIYTGESLKFNPGEMQIFLD